MFGKFEKNKLRNLLVKGNAESVYYNRNEETNVIETITKEISSNIEFLLTKGVIESIKYLKASDGKTYPPSMLPEDVKKLKGFIWRESEQPKKMEDIFTKDSNEKKAPIKKKKKAKKNPAVFNEKTTKKGKKIEKLKRLKNKDFEI